MSKTPETLAKAISKQSVEGAAWILLVVSSKMCEERDKLREELLCKKEAGLEKLGNYQFFFCGLLTIPCLFSVSLGDPKVTALWMPPS